MSLQTNIVIQTLHFKQAAGTSRGTYTERKVWYVVIEDKQSGAYGVGECAPLPNLSCDDVPNYDEVLQTACTYLEKHNTLDIAFLRSYPSILFGLETALQHLKIGSVRLWDTPFSRGEKGIPINGLIWMGTYDNMLSQIESKMKAGFRCLKLKIGAIAFDEELSLIKHIRQHYSSDQIELRVDANGAFTPEDALFKLEQLAQYDLHSIEQPIRAGQWSQMAELCRNSPLPIALDEELIGINEINLKCELLENIRPPYIILKPSLHGGMIGSEEWIKLAEELNIQWWITSALESNVGLNAIAQWCATLNSKLPQGLGTGMLFTDNIDYPLHIKGDCLWFDTKKEEPEIFPKNSNRL